MTRAIPFAASSWLALCNKARAAIGGNVDAADSLGKTAGQLTTIDPPQPGADARALCNAFRWQCTLYSMRSPADRAELAPGLKALEWRVRALVEPTPEAPGPVVEEPFAALKSWQERKDLQ